MSRPTSLLFSLMLLPFIFTAETSFASDQTGYWQQEVNYKYDITLAGDLRTITGRSEIEYINNSPDTLKEIYFKAFPNAIKKGSYADLKARSTRSYGLSDLKPENEGDLAISRLEHAGRVLTPEMDNSVIRVVLIEPIVPGETTYFNLEFTILLPSPASMRMGVTKQTTNAAYWHPAVCVYDRELGWCNGQYLGWGEWYGDYGKFDVKITAPADQIVAATGVCVNEDEMIPPDLRAKLDIKNYLKPKSQWPSLDLDPAQTKTWHYVAENVPDFVFTASSSFCLDSDSINGVEVVAYPLRDNAANWTKAVTLGKQTVESYSESFLPYQWPVVRICDAYSGMEYPMLTNCSNRQGPDSKQFAMLVYHEVGHCWFMGLIGSNQTDRPFLDEGFNTHAEHVTMERYLGRMGNYDHHDSWFKKKFYPETEDRNVRGFRPLLFLMRDGYDKEMVFSYDQGDEYWPFRVSAYYKTAAMHYSLRSILGDSTYFDAMRYYCRKWLFKHPYEDDFVAAMEEATGVELTEYLRQWLYLTDRLDYAVEGMRKEEKNGNFTYSVELENRGDFVSPVDVVVVWEQGDSTFYTISPEGISFKKPGYINLPTWHQFRRFDKQYEFTVRARRQIKQVVVDPYELLMDINRLNNRTGMFPPTEIRVDNLVYDRAPLNAYALRWRPDFWYDTPNGFQIGLHSHGSFLETIHHYDFEGRFGTASKLPTLDLRYSTIAPGLGRNLEIFDHILRADHRTYISSGVIKRFKPRYTVPDQYLIKFDFSSFTFDHRTNRRDIGYEAEYQEYLDTQDWFAANTYNIAVTLGSLHTFKRGSFRWIASTTQGYFEEALLEINETEFRFGPSSYRGFLITDTEAELRFGLTRRVGAKLSIRRDVVIGDPPQQYRPRLSRANSVTAFTETSLFRSPGSFPSDWQGDFYLSGGRVRGYQDRGLTFTHGWSGTFELSPPDLLPFKWLKKIPLAGRYLSKADQSFFFDLAYVKNVDISPENVAYSSAGMSINLPAIWAKQKIRLDFPLYLNEPRAGEKEFEFRFSAAWILPGLFD